MDSLQLKNVLADFDSAIPVVLRTLTRDEQGRRVIQFRDASSVHVMADGDTLSLLISSDEEK